MKKIVGLLLILVMVTGCSEDYKLKINQDSISEEINFSIGDNDTEKAVLINELFRITDINYENESDMGEFVIDRLRNDNLGVGYDIDDFYTKTVDGDDIILSYTYKEGSYGNSNAFNSCFGNIYFDSNEDYYVINGYNQFKCLVKDKVKVVVETDYRVIDSNADKVIGNKYVWYFTKDNNLEHDLYIQVSKKYKRRGSNYFTMIIVGGIIIGFVIYKFVFKKDNFRLKFNSNNDV